MLKLAKTRNITDVDNQANVENVDEMTYIYIYIYINITLLICLKATYIPELGTVSLILCKYYVTLVLRLYISTYILSGRVALSMNMKEQNDYSIHGYAV